MSLSATALRYLDEQDIGLALHELARQEDALGALKATTQVMRELYWKRKDLPASVLFACAGMSLGFAWAARTSDPALADQLRGIVKGLAYDIASFTWPGWDEPGIVVTASDLRAGMEG